MVGWGPRTSRALYLSGLMTSLHLTSPGRDLSQPSNHPIIKSENTQVAGHGDDMMYLSQASPHPVPMHRRQDLHMQDILVTLWTNFASTGNPTINGTLGFRWTPVTPKRPLSYLSLTVTPNMQKVDRVVCASYQLVFCHWPQKPNIFTATHLSFHIRLV
ncbi:hypothetical protein O3P69_017135 [Scylla paramamosain]|uniref:Carboxylesterase type B domain-containing protein n=1 Tax=Scylla paramamosain TaxID=85552 RepID=A0AAW0TYR1_SCYPA